MGREEWRLRACASLVMKDTNMTESVEYWRSKRSQRQRDGAIILNKGKHVFPCLVLETSLSGARIRVDRIGPLPTNFFLCIKEDRVTADCEIVWRKGQELGVRIFSFKPYVVAPEFCTER
jgi:hypothetical protein